MNEQKIQQLANAFPAKMAAKGLLKPEFNIWFRANEEVQFYARWDSGSRTYDDFKIESAKDVAAAFNAADKWVNSLPSAEETKLRQFMAAVGGAIDLGRQVGIDVEFLNPLSEMMKRLSENALTDQRDKAHAAAEAA